MGLKLSILICSITKRTTNSFSTLIQNLERQIEKCSEPDSVEIISIVDNKKRSVGKKRNELKSLAQGLYITYVDDDDRPNNNYVQEILNAINSNDGVDVINYIMNYYNNGSFYKQTKYSIKYTYKDDYDFFYRTPFHTCVFRKDIVDKVHFQDVSRWEDAKWSQDLLAHLKTEFNIDKDLYNYYYDSNKTETQNKR